MTRTENNPQLVFATRNRGKIAELKHLLGEFPIEVLAVQDLSKQLGEVVEDGTTFVANATKKALQVSQESGLPALADDSGLEVDALDGAPGVRSARFAGVCASDHENNRKLVDALQDVADDHRTARFHCALVLADWSGRLGREVIITEGVCEGRIVREPRGNAGFGYDPLFYVPSLGGTFAELGMDAKSSRSHRALAMKAMIPRLIEYLRLALHQDSG